MKAQQAIFTTAAPSSAWVWEGVLLYTTSTMSTAPHAHFPATLLIGLERPFALTVGGRRSYHRAALLGPNVVRATDSEGGTVIDLLVDPDIRLFRYLLPVLGRKSIVDLPRERFAPLQSQLSAICAGELRRCREAGGFVRELLTCLSPQPAPRLPWDHRVLSACALWRAQPATALSSIGEVAIEVDLSESRFSHLFRKEFGIPPSQYLLWLRIRHAMRLWAQGLALSEVASGAGFYDHPHFTRTLRKMTDHVPSMLAHPINAHRHDCSGVCFD